MANLQCSMCESEPAAFLLNNLIDGGTEQVGANCWPLFIISIAEAMTGLNESDAHTAATEPETAIAVETPTDDEDEAHRAVEPPPPDPKPSGRSRARSSAAPTATEAKPVGETIADPVSADAE